MGGICAFKTLLSSSRTDDSRSACSLARHRVRAMPDQRATVGEYEPGAPVPVEPAGQALPATQLPVMTQVQAVLAGAVAAARMTAPPVARGAPRVEVDGTGALTIAMGTVDTVGTFGTASGGVGRHGLGRFASR